jgi:hypothetical protein
MATAALLAQLDVHAPFFDLRVPSFLSLQSVVETAAAEEKKSDNETERRLYSYGENFGLFPVIPIKLNALTMVPFASKIDFYLETTLYLISKDFEEWDAIAASLGSQERDYKQLCKILYGNQPSSLPSTSHDATTSVFDATMTQNEIRSFFALNRIKERHDTYVHDHSVKETAIRITNLL